VLNHGTSILSRTSLFTNIQVTIFDGQTFAIQKRPISLGSILAGAFAGMTRDPLTELDNAAFPEPATEAVNSAILREPHARFAHGTLDRILAAYLKRSEA